MAPAVVLATEERYTLAEGPVWDPTDGVLRWVDIVGGLVLEGDLMADGRISVLASESFGETVGAVVPSIAGARAVVGAVRLHVRAADGKVTPGRRLLPAGSGRRLNDAKADPSGRLLVGTLSLAGASTSEELLLVGDDDVRVIDRDLTLSNGLAWSPDGRLLYSVDTERRVIYRRPWSAADGTWGERTIHLALDEGYPDGICIDADGHLWVAMWGLGQVRRHAPGGALVASIDIPAPHTSSVAFAGPGLDILVITTAKRDLAGDELTRYPGAGALFTTRPGVRGLPQALWTGTA
jgi:sugar lactone lactonase YvrE